MRLPGEQEEKGISRSVIYSIVAFSLLILIILACVLVSNSKKKPVNSFERPENAFATAVPEEDPYQVVEEFDDTERPTDIETLYENGMLRAEDLDFWDMYDDNEPIETPAPTKAPTPEPSREPTDEEKAADGKHVQVAFKDGTKEWILIDPDLPAKKYDFTKMNAVNGKMVYYDGNQKLSRLGVMLSEENTEVDFEAVKEDGIDFVILKVGGRGYETGVISIDTAFPDYAEKAKEAGLKVGAYFSSQAVTIEEAKEEALFVDGILDGYEISYPVVFRMDSFTYDSARTDILDVDAKTEIIQTFLDTIEEEGYHGVLYGSKDFILTEVLYEKLLPDTEIWLTEDKPVPDYPYHFQMWEYAQAEKVKGVSGSIGLTISFVDYAQR